VTNNTRLPDPSYLPTHAPVNARVRGRAPAAALRVLAPAAALLVLALAGWTSAQPRPVQDADCRRDWTTRFAPADPDAAGLYVVCRSARPLDELRRELSPGPLPWPVESRGAADAFAGAPPEVRRALALLYGGRLLSVSRGWRRRPPEGVDAISLIAPAPGDTLETLVGGTLVIIQHWQHRQHRQHWPPPAPARPSGPPPSIRGL